MKYKYIIKKLIISEKKLKFLKTFILNNRKSLLNNIFEKIIFTMILFLLYFFSSFNKNIHF